MNKQEAAALAGDITDTFPITPKLRIWIEALQPMELDTARRTYVQLRRNRHDRDLSIGVFTDEYRRLRPPPPQRIHECDLCGDGWQTTDYTHNGHTYRGVIPCTCPTGRNHESTWNTVRTNEQRA